MKTGIPPTQDQVPTRKLDLATLIDGESEMQKFGQSIAGLLNVTIKKPIYSGSRFQTFTFVRDLNEDFFDGELLGISTPILTLDSFVRVVTQPDIYQMGFTVGIRITSLRYDKREKILAVDYYIDYIRTEPPVADDQFTPEVVGFTGLLHNSVTVNLSGITGSVFSIVAHYYGKFTEEYITNLLTTPQERKLYDLPEMTAIQRSTPINRRESFRLLNLFRRKRTRNEKEGY